MEFVVLGFGASHGRALFFDFFVDHVHDELGVLEVDGVREICGVLGGGLKI